MNRQESAIACIEGYLAGRYELREYPSLSAQAERFAAARPFAGRALLDCTPVFANTLLKYVSLLKGGAALTVGVCEPIPHDPAVVRFLEDAGVPVLRDSADAVRAAVKDCDFIVTATGVKGAMQGYGLGPLLRERAEIVVAAIGIEDEWLDELDRGRIVNNGVAVNFALDEPTLLRYIDPTMALSNESAADLLAGTFAASGIVRPSAASERLCLDPVLACGLIADEIKDNVL